MHGGLIKEVASFHGSLVRGSTSSLINNNYIIFFHRALDHPNLCRFIGATVVNPSIVSEYCPKGSLSDVLQNEGIIIINCNN